MVKINKLKHQFKTILSLDSHPGHISVGFAVGNFISFTPFFGLHTPIAIALAFLFRLNKVACITVAWVNTLQPYAKSILLGSSIVGFIAAIASYFLCYWLVTFFRRKDAALKELTREM